MAEVIQFPSPNGKGPGGTGPEDPMLEQRVANLEKSVVQMDAKLSAIELVLAEIKGQLSQFPKAMDFAALKADVAEIKGRIANLPTTWTLVSFAVGACIASAGLAFTIARLIKP